MYEYVYIISVDKDCKYNDDHDRMMIATMVIVTYSRLSRNIPFTRCQFKFDN